MLLSSNVATFMVSSKQREVLYILRRDLSYGCSKIILIKSKLVRPKTCILLYTSPPRSLRQKSKESGSTRDTKMTKIILVAGG